MSKSKESGPVPALPEVCLLHLNFQPCPWCEPEGEVEATTIDTTPKKRTEGKQWVSRRSPT